MHMYEIWKDGTDEPACRTGLETHVENRNGDTVGEGEGGTNSERIDIYTLSCAKYIACGKLPHSTKRLV